MISSATLLLPSGAQRKVEELDHLSFVNDESYGKAAQFGVQVDDEGHRTLIVCTRNVAAVEVEV